MTQDNWLVEEDLERWLRKQQSRREHAEAIEMVDFAIALVVLGMLVFWILSLGS